MKKIQNVFFLFLLAASFFVNSGCVNKIKEGSISGTVILDESSNQNAGFTVSVAGTGYQATTASSGQFIISGVPAKSGYEIIVVKGDFVKTWKNDVEVLDAADTDLGTLKLTSEEIKNLQENKDPNSQDKDKSDKNVNSNIEYNISFVQLEVQATDRGILFTYAPMANTNISEPFEANVNITELESDITLYGHFERRMMDFAPPCLEYPFVEAGKEYKFRVIISYSDSIFLDANVCVTATGGLGEYKVINSNEITTSLSADRVISRSSAAKFTDNKKVTVNDEGVFYSIYRDMDEGDEKFSSLRWVYDTVDWASLSNSSFDIKDVAYYSGWISPKTVEYKLSGHKYRIMTRTVLKISGYTSYESIFYMNDKNIIKGDWGGNKYKVARVYGVKDITSRYDKVLYKDSELTGYSGLPGKPATLTFNDETNTYPFVEFEYYSAVLQEPEFTLKFEDVPVSYIWNEKYPYTVEPHIVGTDEDGNTVLVDTKFYVIPDPVEKFYTVKLMMNDGSDAVYKVITLNSKTSAKGTHWSGALNIDLPVSGIERSGYTFNGWYKEAECLNKISYTLSEYWPADSLELKIYAGWTSN